MSENPLPTPGASWDCNFPPRHRATGGAFGLTYSPTFQAATRQARRDLLWWRLVTSFDCPTLLQTPRHEPAQNRPDNSGGPTGKDIGWIMHAEIDAADADQKCQQFKLKGLKLSTRGVG